MGIQQILKSLPVRGAWIEIVAIDYSSSLSGSLPVRGAWIEMSGSFTATRPPTSLPVRGAWIEIGRFRFQPSSGGVAPRAGSVD